MQPRALALGLALALGASTAAAAPRLRLCTSETPFLPLSSVDPARPGRSQILIEMVALRLGLTIEHVVAPWKRCQLLVERGIHDAMNVTGYAGVNPTIAVFPMRDGAPDTTRSLGAVPSFLYRRVGHKADFVGGSIVGTDKPVAVLTARQVNMDAIRRAGGTSEDGAGSVSALAHKLFAGQVDLAASAELDFAELVASQYKGLLEALPTPLVLAHYYVVFSRQYFAAHRAQAEAFWQQMAAVAADPAYAKRISAIR